MYPLGYDQNGFVATHTYITHIFIYKTEGK